MNTCRFNQIYNFLRSYHIYQQYMKLIEVRLTYLNSEVKNYDICCIFMNIFGKIFCLFISLQDEPLIIKLIADNFLPLDQICYFTFDLLVLHTFHMVFTNFCLHLRYKGRVMAITFFI